jgi:hypothetical protein
MVTAGRVGLNCQVVLIGAQNAAEYGGERLRSPPGVPTEELLRHGVMIPTRQ